MKFKLTVHFEHEYEARSEYYGTDNVKEMLKIDKEGYQENPELLFELLSEYSDKIKIEVILIK